LEWHYRIERQHKPEISALYGGKATILACTYSICRHMENEKFTSARLLEELLFVALLKVETLRTGTL